MGYVVEFAETLARARAELRASDRVLDVGCGTQPYRDVFAGLSFVGIDVEVSGRAREHKTPDVYFDGRRIPFADGEFGLVMCIEVLEHAVEPNELLAEMYRVMRPSGTLVLTTPFLWGEHESPFDFRRYSAHGLRRAVEGTGFRVLRQDKLLTGRHALTALLRSEIKAARAAKRGRSKAIDLALRGVDQPLGWLWNALVAYWASVYGFERLYVRNLLVARKDG